MKKKLAWPMALMTVSLNLYAQQDPLSALGEYQRSGSSNAAETTGSSKISESSTKASKETVVEGHGPCASDEQSSLPRNQIKHLLMGKDAKLRFDHNSEKEELVVNGGNFVANCQAMLEWKLEEIPGATKKDRKDYAVQYQFAKNSKCVNGKCSYTISKKVDGQFKNEIMSFEPNYKGFQDCLKASGVINKEGKVDPLAIYRDQMKVKFPNVKDSGKITLHSIGPLGKQEDPEFGYVKQVGCDIYEKVSEKDTLILSTSDAKEQRILDEKDKVCASGDYREVADFISKNEAFSDELSTVLEKMFIEKAKTVAKKLEDMEKDPKIVLDDADLEIISDFGKYVVEPLAAKADAKYKEYEAASGDEKKHKKKELTDIIAKLKTYKTTPYFQEKHINSLVVKGHFDTAESLNTAHANLKNRFNLGGVEQGVTVTADVAKAAVESTTESFKASMVTARSEWDLKTGVAKAKSPGFYEKQSQFEESIKTRTTNFTADAQYYASRAAAGGACDRIWGNGLYPAKLAECKSNAGIQAQETIAQMNFYNEQDRKVAAEFKSRGDYYKALEDQGARHIASQYADPAASAAPAAPAVPASNPVTPPARTPDPQTTPYTFQLPQQAYQGQQQQQYYQQPQTQQYPYMGQQNYQNMGYNYTQGGQVNNGYYGQMQWGVGGQQAYNPYQQQQYSAGYNPYQQYQQQSPYQFQYR